MLAAAGASLFWLFLLRAACFWLPCQRLGTAEAFSPKSSTACCRGCISFLAFSPARCLVLASLSAFGYSRSFSPKKFPRFCSIINIKYMKLGTAEALLPPVPNFSELIQNIDHFLCVISYYWALNKFCFGTILQLACFCTQQFKNNEISFKIHIKRWLQTLKASLQRLYPPLSS